MSWQLYERSSSHKEENKMPVRDTTKRIRQVHPACGKTVTEQHHAKTCNINYIIAKYQKTGLVSHINKHEGRYGDVSGADYERAMELVTDQETMFNELPSSVRAHYDNDVAEYLEHVRTAEGAAEHAQLLNPAPEVPEEEITAPAEPQPATEPETEPVT